MTDDDALARALEENRRRSEVMADAQQYGPPAPRDAPVVRSQAALRPHEVEKRRKSTSDDEQRE